MQKLIYKKNKKILIFSVFIFKLFKKYLSSKLTLYYNHCCYENILLQKFKKKINLLNLKSQKFYNRKDIVPLRLFRYYLYFNISKLINLNVGFIVTNKLIIYNGKLAKPINIFKVKLNNLLDVILNLVILYLLDNHIFLKKNKLNGTFN